MNQLIKQRNKYKLSSESFKDKVNKKLSESNVIYIVSFIFFLSYLLISALN